MIKHTWWLLLTLTPISLSACAPGRLSAQATAPTTAQRQATDAEFAKQRRHLVEEVRSQGIKSKAVLNALLKVPRHKFVPPAYQDLAYKDQPLPISHDQTISQPFIVAYMTEAAEIMPGEKVLEIGTGSGYQAAILSQLAREVYSIEIIPALAQSARALLGKSGYKNVHVKSGNGYAGWVEHAPFDAIVVTAAPDHIPQALVDQLAVNGKMVIPVGSSYQEMMVITKTRSGVVTKRTIPVMFVPMTGKPKK